MRTTLLIAAVIAALVIPIVAYREAPVPLATVEQGVRELDPVLDMVSNECTPTLQHLEDGLTLIRLCANAR
jgi:hypothetical protein